MVAVFLAFIVAIVVALVVATAGRYLPLQDDVRELRASAQRLSDDVEGLEPANLERATLDELSAEFAVLAGHLEPISEAIDDPLVKLVGSVGAVAAQYDAATSLVAAAESLVEVGDIGLGLVDEVVTLREQNEADPDFELTAGLVEFIATSSADVDRIDQLIADAQQDLAAIPDDAAEQILEARDLVAEPLDTYLPLLEQYREIDDIAPELMGWGGQKQYLVLAQNPAELRPAGGYAGTVGLITVEDGSLTSQEFINVYDLDLQKDLPFVEPPEELTEILLAADAEGNPQSWRLADAAWSPDYPTGAEKSAEFYAIEADGTEVDGVIAITTYALDRLLEVVGPVDVPQYDVTVEPGEVTLTLLGATRGSPSRSRAARRCWTCWPAGSPTACSRCRRAAGWPPPRRSRTSATSSWPWPGSRTPRPRGWWRTPTGTGVSDRTPATSSTWSSRTSHPRRSTTSSSTEPTRWW